MNAAPSSIQDRSDQQNAKVAYARAVARRNAVASKFAGRKDERATEVMAACDADVASAKQHIEKGTP